MNDLKTLLPELISLFLQDYARTLRIVDIAGCTSKKAAVLWVGLTDVI